MKNIAQFNPLILVAEDDPDDALLLKDAFLETDQSKVAFLDNGKLLLEYIKQLQLLNKVPQLIVIDLNMPILDGRSVIKELRKNKTTSNIPLVVLSTTKNQDDIDMVMSLGADAFFTKPSSYSDLVAITAAISKKWLTPK